MACITWLAAPLAMATTQVGARLFATFSASVQFETTTISRFLRLNWVVVTGSNGHVLCSYWTTNDLRPL